MTRRRLLVVLLLGAVALLAMAYLVLRDRQDGPREVMRLSVRMPIPIVDTAFSPYYLAIDKGYFARQGLAVELVPGSPELNPVKMVVAEKDAFGVLGGPELLLRARSEGKLLVGIVQIHKDSDFVVVVTKKKSGLSNIKSLEGKTVGFCYAHISTDILRMLFKKSGVTVEERDVGFSYSPFIADQLPAQWAFRTTAGLTLPEKGIDLNIISPADYGIRTQGHIVVTTERMIKEKPEVVQRFVNGVLDGLRHSVEHVDEAVESSCRRDAQFSRSLGLKQMEVYRATIIRNRVLGMITLEDMEATKQQMLPIGLPGDLDVGRSFTTRFVESYHKAQK